MTDFVLKDGDLLPTFDVQLFGDNSEVDLSSGVDSIKFYMRKSDGTLVINGEDMTFITDGSDGKVRYTSQSGDTDVSVQTSFTAEIVVTWTSGTKPQTFPNYRNLTITIFKDVK